MTTQLHLTGPLGEQISVTFTGNHLDILREWGRKGFTSGDVPVGGYQMPLALEPNFDWALIGAKKWTNPEGEEMILHRGHAYRRRELAALESKKMNLPAAVKISRGAKPTDPEHIREKSDGEIEYVTLAIFRGGRASPTEYEVPRPAHQRPQAGQERQEQASAPPVHSEAPPQVSKFQDEDRLGEEWAEKLADALRGLGINGPLAYARGVARLPELASLADLTVKQSRQVKHAATNTQTAQAS